MLKKKISIFGFLFLLTTLIAGCGYSLKSALPSNYKHIYVAPFANKVDISQENDDYSRYKSYKPMLETDITKAVLDAFVSDGSLKISSNPETADIVLSGDLVGFLRQPLQYDTNMDVRQYRLNIVIDMTLKDNKGKIIWRESYFVGESTFMLDGRRATSEADALDTALRDLSKRVVERVVENW